MKIKKNKFQILIKNSINKKIKFLKKTKKFSVMKIKIKNFMFFQKLTEKIIHFQKKKFKNCKMIKKIQIKNYLKSKTNFNY